MNITSTKRWAAAAVLPMLLFGAAVAQAAPWTAAGSTGTVDEADLQLFSVVNGEMTVSSAVAGPATLDARYNIVALDGIENLASFGLLRIRFRDNGSDAQVVLRLKAYNLETGITSTLGTFDSNTYPASSGYQTQQACIPLVAPLNFEQNAYFIDAQLIKSTSRGTPGLGVMRLTPGDCVG